jgi:hypothetical protein
MTAVELREHAGQIHVVRSHSADRRLRIIGRPEAPADGGEKGSPMYAAWQAVAPNSNSLTVDRFGRYSAQTYPPSRNRAAGGSAGR